MFEFTRLFNIVVVEVCGGGVIEGDDMLEVMGCSGGAVFIDADDCVAGAIIGSVDISAGFKGCPVDGAGIARIVEELGYIHFIAACAVSCCEAGEGIGFAVKVEDIAVGGRTIGGDFHGLQIGIAAAQSIGDGEGQQVSAAVIEVFDIIEGDIH